MASRIGSVSPQDPGSEFHPFPAGPAWLAQVSLRTVRQSDLLGLEWDGEYTHFRRMYRQVFTDSLKGRAVMWVAELPPVGLIGQVFIHLHSARIELANGVTRAYLYGFRVKPAYRDHGLGTTMLRIVEDDLVKRRFSLVTLNVAKDNPDARRFYERYGYHVIGDEPGRWSYLDDQGKRQEVYEPAYRMEKRLDPQDPKGLVNS